MRYGSVCSGIEAASAAWEPLGWKPQWFSEIAPFPSAVLSHRFPDVINHGDLSNVVSLAEAGRTAPIDVLVGGTPCQAFSPQGARKSLGDERGNLCLLYARLVNVLHFKQALRASLWENVPGVLTARDNAFGCVLAALVGAGEPFVPKRRWSSCGVAAGPLRTAAWRCLDAQYFGLPQRRKRLFLVTCPRGGADPAEVLLEPSGGCWDTEKGRKTTENPPKSTKIGPSRPSFEPIAFSSKDDGGDAGRIAPTLRSMGYHRSHANAGGQMAVLTERGLRRLTPRECERLMGFPDDWTLVPYRKGMSANGPRYHALGNSMAVPVMRWIGERLHQIIT